MDTSIPSSGLVNDPILQPGPKEPDAFDPANFAHDWVEVARAQHRTAEKGSGDLTTPVGTPREEFELRFRQRFALSAMLDCGSITEAAQLAGVSRMTVYRWMKDDTRFREALARNKQEQRALVRQQLQSSAETAMQNLRRAVAAGHLGASVVVLRGLGLLSPKEVPTIVDDAPPALPAPNKRRQLPVPKPQSRELLIAFTQQPPAQEQKLIECNAVSIEMPLTQPAPEMLDRVADTASPDDSPLR